MTPRGSLVGLQEGVGTGLEHQQDDLVLIRQNVIINYLAQIYTHSSYKQRIQNHKQC